MQLRGDLNLLDDQVRFADLDQLDELAVCYTPTPTTAKQHPTVFHTHTFPLPPRAHRREHRS